MLEKEILQFWEENKIYAKVKEANKGGEPFYFCDGPPYATGQIHPGTAWNKCIKDAVCRYKRSRGFNVRDQAGYDTHGLPIEVKVEKELNLKSKKEIEKIGVLHFVQKCKEFANRYIGVMSSQFQRTGVWLDFGDPYITYRDSYIEACWQTIKAAAEKGLLSRGVYVLPYCSRCGTTLANYELEYDDQEDPAIYVKMRSVEDESEYFVIWTTTPWTLVSNIAIMVHPTYTYVKLKMGKETWIVAKDLAEKVMALVSDEPAVILGEMSGKRLEGKKYIHPLAHKIGKERERKVVLSDEFVTTEEGTGLVHCAPGHGPEDFIVGKRNGLEIYSPLDDKGCFTGEAGDYAGHYVRGANQVVIDDLDAVGALVEAGKITHRYPRCWRCQEPLVFLTTDQWFITVSKLRERMLEEIHSCRWHPDYAQTRFHEFVTVAPDWCISRQRYWGIPLPIWVCPACGEVKVIGSKAEIPPLKELHRPFIDEVRLPCPKCQGEMQRVPDILDVWFDSGNAIWASMRPGEAPQYQADFIVEGKDQIRGWFYSLLGSGVVLKDKIPYRNLLMHGHFVDEKGEKMSKSLGNFVPLEEIVDKYGADTFRLWGLSSTLWDDLKFSWVEIKEAQRVVTILHNVHELFSRFYLERYGTEPRNEEMELEDHWVLSRLESLSAEATAAFEDYEVHRAAKAYRQFIVEDLSHFYLKLLKKRRQDDRRVAGAFATFYRVYFTLLCLLAPITPFSAEKLYQEAFRKKEKAESVFLLPWPTVDKKRENSLLERRVAISREIVAAMTNARQLNNLKLRWPLAEAVIVTTSTEVKEAAEHCADLIEALANVKKIETASSFPTSYAVTPQRNQIGMAFKAEAAEVLQLLGRVSPEELAAAMGAEGTYQLDGKHTITKEMLKIEEQPPHHVVAGFSGGKVYLQKGMDTALFSEAMAREVARRIQIMRKELGLRETDKIELNLVAEEEFLKTLEPQQGLVASQTGAASLSLSKKPELKGAGTTSKEWEIEDFEVKIIVKKKD